MRALTLCQPYASLVAGGEKSVETRTWATRHRGPLLICAGKRAWPAPANYAGPRIATLPRAVALCVVHLLDCRRMGPDDWQAACCEPYPNAWAWVLAGLWPVDQFKVVGRQQLFTVEHPSLSAFEPAA
jgi:hypothetical protein